MIRRNGLFIVSLNVSEDGKTRTLDVSNKLSSAIFEELMEIGGGERWRRYKQEVEMNDDSTRNIGMFSVVYAHKSKY